MIGQTVSRYHIQEKIGEGGMSIVYRAEDTRLQRAVALKFLKLEGLGDDQSRERFLREARATASLQHPNICTVYEIDEVDGQTFIAMAFAEGDSLKHRLETGSLKIEEAIDYTVQAARGLESAHARGIVHRDIKSDNIFVSDAGHVTLIDFGIAKLCDTTDITKETEMVGTVSYMSPEQVKGDPVDFRTDIWSLGVCLYEMLAGVRPFRGERDPAVLYSILNEDPEPLSSIIPVVPLHLERIVDRALTKEPEERYQDMAEMLADLNVLKRRIGIDASPGEYEGPRGPSRVAVLPFENMSADPDQEYFCEGIAEDILNKLAHIEGLHVAARTSAAAYKGKTLDIRDVGRKLAVDTVLEGSVRKAGDRLRITAQLINVENGFHKWSEQYNCHFEDVFAVQDEIAEKIVTALKVELSDEERRAMGRASTSNPKAYDYYLRGRNYMHKIAGKNLMYAVDMFEHAIELDPDYALAYAGMAHCYVFRRSWADGSPEHLVRAVDSSRRALELDPDLAEGHAARGHLLTVSGTFEEAKEEFQRAIEINPKLFDAYYFYARACLNHGKFDQAVALFERAGEIDPEDYQVPALLAQTLRGLGHKERAQTLNRRALELARRRIDLEPDDTRAMTFAASSYVDLGRIDQARALLARALEVGGNDLTLKYNLACVYSRVGDTEEAIGFLEEMIGEGVGLKSWMENDPDLDNIRDDPRYHSMIQRLKSLGS